MNSNHGGVLTVTSPAPDGWCGSAQGHTRLHAHRLAGAVRGKYLPADFGFGLPDAG